MAESSCPSTEVKESIKDDNLESEANGDHSQETDQKANKKSDKSKLKNLINKTVYIISCP